MMPPTTMHHFFPFPFRPSGLGLGAGARAAAEGFALATCAAKGPCDPPGCPVGFGGGLGAP
eukprot:13756848-Alexandrium_andersonii.AAC.1